MKEMLDPVFVREHRAAKRLIRRYPELTAEHWRYLFINNDRIAQSHHKKRIRRKYQNRAFRYYLARRYKQGAFA